MSSDNLIAPKGMDQNKNKSPGASPEQSPDINGNEGSEKQEPFFTVEERAKLQNVAALMLNKKEQKELSVLFKDEEKLKRTETKIQKEEGIFYFHNKYCVYDARSLFVLHHKFKIRRGIVWLTEWKWFDRLIILIIAMNSMFLPFYDYTDRDNNTRKNQIIQQAGQIFSILFTIEAVLKISSMGFIIHKNAYLRDGWNWIDFLVVILGIIELIPAIPSANLKALRTLRVMRPLRSINAIPSMRRLLSSLFASIPALGNAATFLFFIFILFGILGLQQFNGAFYQRCRLTPEPLPGTDIWPIDTSIERLCSLNDSGGQFQCPADRYCGSPIEYNLTLKNEDLLSTDFMGYGIVTFDNLAIAMLTIFVNITLEGWTQMMYNMMDASMSWMAILFFILLTVLGAFFLLQVILAIIMDAFDEVDQRYADEVAEKNKEIQKAIRRAQKREQKEKQLSESLKLKQLGRRQSALLIDDDESQSSKEENSNRQMIKEDDQQNTTQFKTITNDNKTLTQIDLIDRRESTKRLLDEQNFDLVLMKQQNGNQQDGSGPDNMEPDQEEFKEGQTLKYLDVDPNAGQENFKLEQLALTQSIYEIPKRAQRNIIIRFFYQVCTHSIFTIVITCFILINTTILALDRYPIDQSQIKINENFNDTLSWFFFLEMIIKLIGLGPQQYVKDKFNMFDCGIVIMSVIENLIGWAGVKGGTGGAISAFRGVRLLRVFKLARSWTSFRVLIEKIIITIKDISNFSVLLFLFMFTYTLLGMEIFAYNVWFDHENNPAKVPDRWNLTNNTELIQPRNNFNFFLVGFTTVFSILIGDGWNEIMYDHIRTLGMKVMPFFVSLYIFGNLILFNLFLAILLKNFEVEEEDPTKIEENKSISKIGIIQRALSIRFQKIKKILSSKLNSETQVNPQQEDKPLESQQNSGRVLEKQQDSVRGSIILLQQMEIQSENEKQQDDNNYDNDELKIIEIESKNPNEDKKILEMHKIDSQPRMSTKIKRNYKSSLIIRSQGNDQNDIKRSSTFINNEANRENLSLDKTDINKLNLTGFNNFKPTSPDTKLTQQNNEDSISDKTNTKSHQRRKSHQELNNLISEKKSVIKKVVLQGNAFFFLSPTNKFRQICSFIVNFKYFDSFILFMILFSTVLLTMDNPLDDPNGRKVFIMSQIDIAVTTIFTLECILKIIFLGFVLNGKDSYLRNGWNVVDIIIVTFAILTLCFSGINLKFIKALRMLRVLRPLRMISRNPALKIAVQSLFNAIPGIVNVMVISVLFLMLFGILGVNFYKGQFYYCVMDNIPERLQDKVIDRWDCFDYGGEWINKDNNFDNLPNAMVTLFNLISSEGWVDVMWSGTDAVAIDQNPIQDHAILNVLFFIIFMIVGNKFVLNLFVGVVINTFSREKEKLGKNHLLTPTQQEWINVQLMLFKLKPEIKFVSTGNKFRDFCKKLEENIWFDRSIFSCIILNTICLSIKWYDSPDIIDNMMEKFNYFFAAVFTLEACIKIIALDKQYFMVGWNVFDFLIVISTFVGIVIGKVSNLSVGPSTTVIRSFRIGRIFRLVKKYKQLRKIFNTFILAIPSLANVGGLLFLLLYLYAILGVFLFSQVQLQDNLDVHANFQSFGLALLTLARSSTGEAWNDIMFDCSRERNVLFKCNNNQSYEDRQVNGIQGCGSKGVAYIYFLSFTIFVSFIFLNLFIAIILEGFSTSSDAEDIRIQEDALNKFKEIWKDYDMKGEGYMNVYKLESLLLDLVQAELDEKENIQKSNNNEMVNDDGTIKEGKHIFFDLHKNKMLAICAQIRAGKTQTGVSEADLQKQMRKEMRRFIAGLRIPTYKNMTCYNFHDILDILSKHFFMNDFQQRQQDESPNISIDNQFVNMTNLQKEILVENNTPDFDIVIDKLYEKGKSQKIEKFVQLKQMRKKHVGKVKQKLDTFHDKRNFIDSQFVVYGQVIIDFIKSKSEKRKQKHGSNSQLSVQRKSQSNLSQNVQTLNNDTSRVNLPQIREEENNFSEIKKLMIDENTENNETLRPKESQVFGVMNDNLQIKIEEDDNVKTTEVKNESPNSKANFQYAQNESFNKKTEQEQDHFYISVSSKNQKSKFLPIQSTEDLLINDTKQNILKTTLDANELNTLITETKWQTQKSHQIKPMQNEKIAPATRFGKLSKNIGTYLNEKILDASRPFSPTRIQTPALFSPEFKRAVLYPNDKIVKKSGELIKVGGIKDSYNFQNQDFSPIQSSSDFSYVHTNSDLGERHQRNKQMDDFKGLLDKNGNLNQGPSSNANFEFSSEEFNTDFIQGQKKGSIVQIRNAHHVPGNLNLDLQIPSPIQSRQVAKREYLFKNKDAKTSDPSTVQQTLEVSNDKDDLNSQVILQKTDQKKSNVISQKSRIQMNAKLILKNKK